jgi:hypothetical protein
MASIRRLRSGLDPKICFLRSHSAATLRLIADAFASTINVRFASTAPARRGRGGGCSMQLCGNRQKDRQCQIAWGPLRTRRTLEDVLRWRSGDTCLFPGANS